MPLLPLLALLCVLAAAPATLVPRDETVRQALPRAAARGLNGEECKKTTDCRGDRLCVPSYAITSSHLYICEPDSKTDCVCLDPAYLRTRCTAERGCDSGERCFHRSSGSRFGLCYSCDAFAGLRASDEDVEPLGDGNCNGENAPPKPSSDVPDDGGLNGDACTKNEQCVGDRYCFESSKAGTSSAYVCDKGSKACICLKADSISNRCQGDAASVRCDPGERCYRADADSGAGLCYSCDALKKLSNVTTLDDGNCDGKLTAAAATEAEEEAAESGSGSGSAAPAPCIGVHHLEHLKRSALVFREHLRADVLCDARGSCATHGHVVVFDGAPMMMGTYCKAHARCERRRMLVNSPRMGARAVRVPSHTGGLEYTAFAARYETALEEHLLRALVRVGL